MGARGHGHVPLRTSHKDRVVARLLPPESAEVDEVSRAVGLSVTTLLRWRAEAVAASSVPNLVGPHADEVINVLGLSIRHGPTAEDIKQTMFGYPTAASDIGYML